jgi:alanine dehydrogenase
MPSEGTLLLQRKDVAELLSIGECMDAVEKAFCLYAEGKAIPPRVLGFHSGDGGFHIKAGILGLHRSYFVAKVNANFPGNLQEHGLPTIQGVIIVCDATNGRLLALMDSIEITIIRTGAATGIAAKYLAPSNATVATVCGCGNQGKISLRALLQVRKLEKIYAYDIDETQSQKFNEEFGRQIEVIPIARYDLSAALMESHVVITCTPSKEPFIQASDILLGTFVAAVGADKEDKQELFSELLSKSKVVVDIAEQSASIGELHHAIKKGILTVTDIHADLGCIIAGKKPGRLSDKEIIVFDSTGTALQDVAAAAIVYEKAISGGVGSQLNFSEYGAKVLPDPKKKLKPINSLRLWYPFR